MDKAKETRRKSWQIDLGDSTVGQIGGVARVIAKSAEDALAIAMDELPEEVEVIRSRESDTIEYFNIYINTNALTVKDVSDPEDIEEE